MKKTILGCALGALLAVISSAFADTLSNVTATVHNSSAGQLIQIYTNLGDSNASGYYCSVTMADGSYLFVDDTKNIIQVANALCNLNKQWVSYSTVFRCIAK